MTENQNSIVPAQTTIETHFEALSMVNYAMYHNNIHVIRKLSICNRKADDLCDITVRISTSTPFAEKIERMVSCLKPNEWLDLKDLDLKLDANYFLSLTEAENAEIKLEICTADATLYSQSRPIKVLTFNEWTGITTEPALLASFVTPNSPALTPIIHRAAELLKEKSGSSSLDGYQTKDVNRAKLMAWSVYEAIVEAHIIYAEPPADFEKNSQRIRLSDEIIDNKLGTCLDTSVLYASCLEAIGLFPLLILTEGHAFVAVWLESDTLSNNICDDASLLTKHIALGSMIAVETTTVTDSNNTEFDKACLVAADKLSDISSFEYAVDVHRARMSDIRPLPQRILQDGHYTINESRKLTEQAHEAPCEISKYDIATDNQQRELTKQDIWERKLLDLSLRNSLLNYRFSQKSMVVLTSDIGKIEDMLYDGEEFQILPKLEEWNDTLKAAEDVHSIYHIDASLSLGKLINQALDKHILYSSLSEADHKTALKNLYRQARTSAEENGANTLYAAIGLLRWFEPKVASPHYAPILLVPVEMVKRGTGYVVRSRDEDTMLNVTLIEMFRQNFDITVNGLDPLPQDEHGIDVPKVFAILRNAIIDQKNWDVEEIALFGNFSFSKFILWNDIHSNMEGLRKNKIVDSLMKGQLQWEATDDMTDASKLDHTLSPADFALPVSADSSQVEAIYEAAQGKSFILHGPPGTGKSQTITNIIANALYQGKRVLFAAEKMAALTVVQNRLAKIGLAPFCLECHSNKAHKTDVLAQLKTASEVSKVKTRDEFLNDAQKMFDLRKSINAYVEALHRQGKGGMSIYQATTRYCTLQDELKCEAIPMPAEQMGNATKEQLSQWHDDVEQLAIVAQSSGHPATHPLHNLHLKQLQADLPNTLTSLCNETVACLSDLGKFATEINNVCGVPAPVTCEQLDALGELSLALTSVNSLSPNLLTQSEIEQNKAQIDEVLAHGKRMTTLREQLSQRYMDQVLNINAEQLKLQWQADESKWFLARWFGQRGINKQLKAYSKSGNVDTQNDLDEIIAYQQEKAAVDAKPQLMQLFGTSPRETPEDWMQMQAQEQAVLNIHHAFTQLATAPQQLRSYKTKLADLLSEGLSTFMQMNGKVFSAFADTYNKLNGLNGQLKDLVGLDKDCIEEQSESQGYLVARTNELNAISGHTDQLKDWLLWCTARQKVADDNIDFVAQYFCDKQTEIANWLNLYDMSVSKAISNYLVSQESVLTVFKGQIFEQNIKRFRALNSKYQQYVQAELYARLAANVPNFTVESTKTSEVGILQKNIQNHGRGTSLRTLFDNIPTLLSRLCPCMLMSPMSVAQYLDVNKQKKFDLVIFDEASQMPTSEAVGAIARGENVIVVGDPKQMPPTSFFNVTVEDEEHPELNDQDSILDDCLALSIPSKHLLWHYRSRHESLIAFSNAQYYDNSLLTFPSPDNRQSKVSFVKVAGSYDKGKSRQNKAEAQAVVNEVLRRLADKNLQNESIGIVTFSLVQQTLIEDMLGEELAKQPELEKIASNCNEPIFVKNLENVQGDERDVILFSIGYGPDKDGRVSMNFGPLNLAGGERRLNVAVSRARHEMVVYSTLTADMIDLNRTNSEGVRGLKEFLDFAQKGIQQYTQEEQAAMQQTESMADVIGEALRKEGYKIDTHIGCSGYRIDIGVVDSKNENRYMLGILCDGDSYRNAKTARDREICQPSVLRSLGWEIMKVWTIDWIENKEAVLKQIKQCIADIASGKSTNEDDSMVQSLTLEQMTHKEQSLDDVKVSAGVEMVSYPKVEPVHFGGGIDALLANKAKIVKRIAEIINEEAPLTFHSLSRRMLQSLDIQRTTKQTDETLTQYIALAGGVICPQEDVNDSPVIWKTEQDATQYNKVRTDSGRDVTDVPVEEFANAMLFVLGNAVSLPEEDLRKSASNLLGYQRMGTQVDAQSKKAIKYLTDNGKIKTLEGKVEIS